MIHLVEGRSGSGKTEYLFRILSELAESGENRLVYLIPEQSSFGCEGEFLRRIGPRAAKNINVMSFTRLYNMVMSKTGGVSGTPIDDSVRRILMSVTLDRCAAQLELYAKAALKPQFVEVALGAVKELKQCGILPDTIRESALSAGSPELGNKLNELALIYELYNASVERSGVDPYDNDMRLEQRIRERNFFDGWTVAVDDFSGFTAQQHKIIELLMKQTKDIYISLCMNPSDGEEGDPDGENGLFFTVERTKTRLKRSAKTLGMKIGDVKTFCGNYRTESESLRFLERNIYRRGAAEGADGIHRNELSRDITAACAGNIYDECEYIAGQISELAMSDECRYRDIAVVLRDTEKYEGILDAALEKCGIPYFMSRPQPVEAKPLMRLAVSALEYAMSPNDEKKLFTAVKSGLLGISDYRIAQLENYAFVWSLKGRQLFGELTMNPQGYADRFTDSDKQLLEDINETRRQIVSPFEKLLESLSSDRLHTAKDISAALYNFMVESGVPELLSERAERELEFSDEGLRLWDIFTDVLGKLHTSLGDSKITVKRYCELLKLVFKGANISDIPQTLDQVLIGKADSVRLRNPYAVFVIGALDGQFPHSPVSDGVFSNTERKRLISLGLPLYDDVTDLFKQERFFVYNAVSAPTNRLFVTYPKSDLKGGTLEPSSIVTETVRLFPALEIVSTSSVGNFERLISEKTAFELYARSFGSRDPFFLALGEYLKDSPEYGGKLSSLGSAVKNDGAALKNEHVPKMLYGRNKRLSASQIEDFYKCRFKYFFSYGVKLRERRKADLDNLVYGNLLHYILENVVREYMKNGCREFKDEELSELLDRLLVEYAVEYLGGLEDKTDRFNHLYMRSKRRIRRTLEHVLCDFSQSEFKPADVELTIDMNGSGLPEYRISVGEGSTIAVRGKIDRVDIAETDDGGLLVRIVDYKTKGKKFKLSEVIDGLNMQMLIYLAAVTENGKLRYGEAPVPAAALYQCADLGSVDIKDVDSPNENARKEKLDKEVSAKLKMSGVILDNEQTKQASGEKADSFIKADKLSSDQLEMIFCYVRLMIDQMSAELDRGSISPSPVDNKVSGNTSCDYCDYRSLCRRDPNDTLRVITNEKTAATLKRLPELIEKKRRELSVAANTEMEEAFEENGRKKEAESDE